MPFTFSHPAIVLPLRRLSKRWFSLTALVIGSIVPDFEYFIRMRVNSIYSHTFGGIFWFDLPLALMLAFIFHGIIRNVFFDNLPFCFQRRISIWKDFNWSRYFRNHVFVVIFSVLIGVLSHLFWDGFTHEDGYFVKAIPSLTHHAYLWGYAIPYFKCLQHISTLAGLILIVFTVIRLPKNEVILVKTQLKFWFLFLGIAALVLIIRFWCGLEISQYGHVIVSMISASFISLTITCLLFSRLDKN
ncbi:DUF4184 family protein [Fulvivirga sediminis]|uniref:DUF4184 family protein n=1 Tax=Fulvivirga sediminis TaxID=2803949 RepID=A0A937FDL8_9BACT|nr:DUF4184 family protein [Fulvivirga sediminis]MBL3658819.1 DUF4184 family protein [Fulvivirga sediminis]